MKAPAIVTIGLLLFARNAFAQLDTNRIEQIMGLNGVWSAAEGVFKITAPRRDVTVVVDGWPVPPFMGLSTWAAFTSSAMGSAMVMGDTVLFEDEVNPVMSVALDNGLSVTALHNHFFFDEPKVYFMHISGEGSADTLAAAVRKVWDKAFKIRAANLYPTRTFGHPALPPTNSIDGKSIEAVLGVKGQANNGMFKVVIGSNTKMMGTKVGKEMGVNTWAAFAGSDASALVDGDFAVQENELQNVLKTLRHGDVNIVAIHSHMAGESPRILFLHYWGRGTAAHLAETLKAALDTQGK